MIRRRFALQFVLSSIALLVLTTSAWADITGTVWRVEGNDNNAGPDSITGVHATGLISEGTFTAPNINFNVPESQNTLDPLSIFLTGADVTGITGGLSDVMSGALKVSPYTDAAQIAANALCHDNSGTPSDSSSCYSTVVEVQGTATFLANQTYTISHDDGAELLFGNTMQTLSGKDSTLPTSDEQSSFTIGNTDVTTNFTIWYMATNGNPELLQLSPNVATPEPAAISMLIAMLVGVTGVTGFMKKKLA